MANTVVGVMAGRQMETDFVMALLTMLSADLKDFRNRVIQTRGYAGKLDKGRNTVIEAFLQNTDGEYLLMLDSDMVFTHDDYRNLLQGLQSLDNNGVVSGIYPREDGSLSSMVHREHGIDIQTTLEVENTKGRWVQCAAVGLGFILIPRRVFEDIQKLEDYDGYFSSNYRKNEHGQVLADDTSLCYYIEKAGYDLWLDKKVQVGHLKQVAMATRFTTSDITVPELVVP